MIACATNQKPEQAHQSARGGFIFSVICAICTNRTQTSLFFVNSPSHTLFYALFLPYFTFVYIFFKSTNFHCLQPKIPSEHSVPRGRL